MRIYWVLILTIFQLQTFAQPVNKKTRAFPITDYINRVNDTTTIVQVHLPEGLRIPEKLMGVLTGIYKDKDTDTVQKGYGRCQLIKGDYYYFGIHRYKDKPDAAEGDLVYVMDAEPPAYEGYITGIARHFIALKDVYDHVFFDRYLVFKNWSAAAEKQALDSMVSDIHFTGQYFLDNNPSMNEEIKSGPYKGDKVLERMVKSTDTDLKKFLEYVSVRPRLYAGQSWKISEIFATWLTAGAPSVIHE